MPTSSEPVTANDSRIRTARLIQSARMTPASSRDEVRELLFHTDDPNFLPAVGTCVRVLAPGQFGNKNHQRLYSIAGNQKAAGAGSPGSEFALCIKRCFYIDDFNGEHYAGVASNYLCDLQPGEQIEFTGPVGYPFQIPDNTNADIVLIGMGTGIAPFRGLIRAIYETRGGWQGKVRLYYGAKSGLEMLYMNDVNNDLANYFDEPTFKAFQAVSPRPALDMPVALDKAIEQNAAELWEMLSGPDCRVFIAGSHDMQTMVTKAMAKVAGSADAWQKKCEELQASGRWSEVLY